MKILQVVNIGYAAGGAEASVRFLRDELLLRGHEVKVLASDMKGEGMFNDYEFKQIPKDSVFKALYYLFYPHAYRTMKTVIAEFHPDVIHFHTVGLYSPSIFFAIGKIPAVLTVHGPEGFTLRLLQYSIPPESREYFTLSPLYWYYRLLQRPLYLFGGRRIRKFIAPSKYLAKLLESDVPREKILQIYNGIPLPKAQSLPTNQRIVYVGRLEDAKGVQYLIEGFRKVVEKIPNAELHIIGDGTYRPTLENIAQTLLLDKSIFFRGWVKAGPEVLKEYEDAVVSVIPSTWPENLPTVCIEALAIGRPVIGTKTGGIPELINDGENGYIVPIGDGAAIGAALIKLLEQKDLLTTMSAAASASAQKFNLVHFVDQIENTYRSTVSNAVE